MEKEYLCKCNKCDAVLYDENPQTGAIKLEVPENVQEMAQVPDGDTFFLACPNCLTDADLVDLPINQ